MGTLAKIATGVMQWRAGDEAEDEGARRAAELKQRAGVRRAVGHREAAEEERNAELAYSRALAVAASSGAGVDDPTVVKLFADLQAEGDYRVLSRLWVAEDEARGIEFRSEVARREGKAKKRAYRAGAFSSFAEAFDT